MKKPKRAAAAATLPAEPLPKKLVAPPDEGAGARDRILSGAERAFRKLGFAAARVEDILAAAEVSRRTFYQRFESKEAVAEALLVRAVEVLVTAASARSSEERTPAAKLGAALDAYLELCQRHGPVVRDLLIESMRHGSRLSATRSRGVDAVVKFVLEQLDGKTKPDPLVVQHVVLGYEGMVLFHMGANGLSASDAEKLRTTLGPVLERLTAKR
jgi:AcrR family transcriptional regulator